jgi:hypothetical protein
MRTIQYYDALQSGRNTSTFRDKILHPSSGYKTLHNVTSLKTVNLTVTAVKLAFKMQFLLQRKHTEFPFQTPNV